MTPVGGWWWLVDKDVSVFDVGASESRLYQLEEDFKISSAAGSSTVALSPA